MSRATKEENPCGKTSVRAKSEPRDGGRVGGKRVGRGYVRSLASGRLQHRGGEKGGISQTLWCLSPCFTLV